MKRPARGGAEKRGLAGPSRQRFINTLSEGLETKGGLFVSGLAAARRMKRKQRARALLHGPLKDHFQAGG